MPLCTLFVLPFKKLSMTSFSPNGAMAQERRATCAATIFFTGAWALWAGKDVSWDVFNHQLYLPCSLVSGRYASDLFAAGPQSYQNPLGYLPFFGLAMSGLPSWLFDVCSSGVIYCLEDQSAGCKVHEAHFIADVHLSPHSSPIIVGTWVAAPHSKRLRDAGRMPVMQVVRYTAFSEPGDC